MKHTIAIKFDFDIKTIRKAISLATGEYLTDDEILERYVNRDPIVIDADKDIGGTDAVQMAAAFTTLIGAYDEVKT